MKTFDPYKVMRIKKDATKNQIKAAFRKLVMKYHPDTGGDPEKFKELHFAYKLLMDDNRRARYDETGVVDEDKPKSENELLSFMAALLNTVLGNLLMMDPTRMTTTDIVKEMIVHASKTLEDVKRQLLQSIKAKNALLEAKDRLTVSEGSNDLASVIFSQVAQYEAQIKNQESQIDIISRTITEVKKYKYRIDNPKGHPMYSNMNTERLFLQLGITR